jgi:hypothetical protein
MCNELSVVVVELEGYFLFFLAMTQERCAHLASSAGFSKTSGGIS